jgi:tetratricopeptide (TPR) repeat protein
MFENDICEMLAVDRTNRPSAVNLRRKFAQRRWIRVGYECLEKKDYMNSITMYTLAVSKEDVVEPLVRTQLGDAYYGVGSYSEAVTAYQAAVDGGIADPKLLTKLGKIHFAIGEYGKAIASYQAALKHDPNNPHLLMQLGDAYLSNQEYKQSIQAFRKGLKKSGNNATLLRKLSQAHHAIGEHDKALKINPKLKSGSSNPSSPNVPVTLTTPEGSDSTEFRVISGTSTRPLPGSLKIDTQVPNLNAIRTNEYGVVTISGEASPRLVRQPAIRRIKSAAPVSGERYSLSVPSVPAALSDTDFPVSIKSRQRNIGSRINNMMDAHSDRLIAVGNKVAALESYSARNFDEMSVSYGDLIEVEEIYKNGWILGVKLKSKVWGESENLSDDEETTGLLDIYFETDSRVGISSQSCLFELSHFCHFEVWYFNMVRLLIFRLKVGHRNQNLS